MRPRRLAALCGAVATLAACSIDPVTFTSPECEGGGSPVVWGLDLDGDGHGDPAMTVVACEQPEGFVLGATDCDDTDADQRPGQTWYLDADQDGSGDPGMASVDCLRPPGHVLDGRDCDDRDGAVFVGLGDCPYRPPGATSCLDILSGGSSEGDGAYAIDPDGAGPGAAIAAYCDMTTDGGGWTALVNPTGHRFAAPAVPGLAMSGEYIAGTTETCHPNTPVVQDFGNGWFGITEYTCGDRANRYHVRWPNPLGARDVRFVAATQGVTGDLRVNGSAVAADGKITDIKGMACQFWNGTGDTFTPPTGLNDCTKYFPDFAPRVLASSLAGPLDLDIEVGVACKPDCTYGIGMNLYKLFVR